MTIYGKLTNLTYVTDIMNFWETFREITSKADCERKNAGNIHFCSINRRYLYPTKAAPSDIPLTWPSARAAAVDTGNRVAGDLQPQSSPSRVRHACGEHNLHPSLPLLRSRHRQSKRLARLQRTAECRKISAANGIRVRGANLCGSGRFARRRCPPLR